ncbi:DNA-binding protein [Streptomyces eurocidicus]|uniref:DNA-binding protein n=1 Tax=Streptomyces eurocidicus TaxID=66423 RepID=A0A2N8NZ35_STREU|nr:helix-turn-helix transcriptional regulator [Streptomyces eurocidicus]MBB5122755.1 transcriptional regulator with XRE-family HTH domain [Streptomyces eurocidicus]MBF6055200.1 helix-turn-helix domain-containing protein [Streptomyces eurocidicus]PNE34034.1 DNA-binding protein [Streptomyces eurocidicus]
MTSAGERIKAVRKLRGLTQRELAAASGVSISVLRRLEQDEQESARMETFRRLATALRVPTMRLVGDTAEGREAEEDPECWDSVKRALNAPPASRGESDDLPTVEGVTEALDAMYPLVVKDGYQELSILLPTLLRDADALGTEGRDVRVRLLQRVGWLMIHTRQFKAAEDALTRSLDEASDRLQAAVAIDYMCWLLMREGQLSRARELATQWADDLEPVRLTRATPTELSMWGVMLLRLSGAAVRDNRPGEAEDAMKYARAASEALGREWRFPQELSNSTFGPLTVLLKTAENAGVVGQPQSVLRIGSKVERLRKSKSPRFRERMTSSDWNRHVLDVADAHTRTGDYRQAVGLLTGINDSAPEWLPNQRFARDILGRMIEERRTLTPEMRDLAVAVRLPV